MIAPEGRVIIIPLLLFTMVSTAVLAVYHPNWLKWMNIFLGILTIFCLYFFRDPNRIIDNNPSSFYSPADGKVVNISEIDDPEIGHATQVSIFLSVFNVHRQWVPYDGKVLDYQYKKGTFFGAFRHKASEKNEQTITLFESDNGVKFKVKQIAGFIARRILNYMSPRMSVEKGQNMGFIRFGSRVDIIVPKEITLDVQLGQMVIGRETVIGRMNEKN